MPRWARFPTPAKVNRLAARGDAAHKLGVANVLTGSFRRSPSTIRVNAQLIDGENGMERWSQSFDRPFGDALQIQTGIAESVAQALSIRLAGADRAALSLGGTRNPAVSLRSKRNSISLERGDMIVRSWRP